MADLANMVATLARFVVEALLNSVWQGAALALLAWLLLRVIPGSNAATRYAVWYAVLLAVFSLPFFNLGSGMPATRQDVETAAIALSDAAPISGSAPLSIQFPILVPGELATSLAFLGWLAVVLALGARLAWDYRNLLRLKRESAILEDFNTAVWTSRAVELRNSSGVETPVMAGFVKPAILFPDKLAGRLTQEDTRQVLLHELAHVRRWDDWTNLGQRIVEVILFFHPASRWIARRLALEREIACDDWVVSVSGAPRPYADCLARLAEIVSDGAACSPMLGSAGERKQIFRRMEMILNRNRNATPVLSKAVFVAALAICLGATWLLARTSPLIQVASPPIPTDEAKASEPAKATKPCGAQEKARKLSEEIQKQVEEEIKPNAAEIQKLAEQLRQEHEGKVPDEAAIRQFEEKIRKIESESVRKAEARARELEAEARRLMLEAQMREREARARKLESETAPSMPPAPPASPAQPVAPVPPAPPAPPAPVR